MKAEGQIVGFDVQGTVPQACHVLADRQENNQIQNVKGA